MDFSQENLDINGAIKRMNGREKRIKELEEALSFTVNALSNFFPFCGHGSIDSLPSNLDATQYQTCSYDGDKSLLEKYIKCRELIKREVK